MKTYRLSNKHEHDLLFYQTRLYNLDLTHTKEYEEVTKLYLMFIGQRVIQLNSKEYGKALEVIAWAREMRGC
jgi:hypothetical protein